jgi:predicted transcriptional regulator
MAKTQLTHEISGGRAIGSRDACRGALRHYRRNLGISQQELANLAKVSQVALSPGSPSGGGPARGRPPGWP